jgi:hypothetical protein
MPLGLHLRLAYPPISPCEEDGHTTEGGELISARVWHIHDERLPSESRRSYVAS